MAETSPGKGRRRSTAGRVLSEARDGFERDLSAASPTAQKRLVVGTFGWLMLLTALAVGTGLWLSSSVGQGPLPGDEWFRTWVEGLLSARTAVWLNSLGSSAILVPAVLTVAILSARDGMAGRAFAILVAFAGCKIIPKAAWAVWDRARPGGVLDALVPAAPAFPSGHVFQAVVVYGLLAAWWAGSSGRMIERGLAWLLAMAVVAATVVSRVRLGAHWASDCWAAILLGGIWTGCVLWAETGYPRRSPAAHVPRSVGSP